MNSRKIHKIIGLILVLPMFGWTITGIIFFTKPGYQGAYEQLSVKTYPIESPLTIEPNNNWQEVKLLKTNLGHHLLVKIDGKNHHLNALTLEPFEQPSDDKIKRLIDDATAKNSARYGEVTSIDGNKIHTSTGIDIQLNWPTLRLSQKGKDTKLINLFYQIHYLQWSPSDGFNRFLGIFGLLLLMSLTFLGVRIFLRKR